MMLWAVLMNLLMLVVHRGCGMQSTTVLCANGNACYSSCQGVRTVRSYKRTLLVASSSARQSDETDEAAA